MQLPRAFDLPYAGISLTSLDFDILQELRCFSSFDFSSAEKACGLQGLELADVLQDLEEEGYLQYDDAHSVWRPTP